LQEYKQECIPTLKCAEDTAAEKFQEVWKGSDVRENPSTSRPKYYLADNMSIWDNKHLAVALYRETGPYAAFVMRSHVVTCGAWLVARVSTWIKNLLSFQWDELSADDADIMEEMVG